MKRLLLLIMITAVFSWIAIDSSLQQRPDETSSKKLDLFAPKLAGAISQITRITLTREDDDNVILTRDEHNIWRVASRSNYPADSERIQKLISTLSSGLQLEEKTSNPELFQHLGLDPKKALRLKIIGTSDNEPLLDTYIGEFKQELGGTYLRRVRDQQSWLVSGEITPDNSQTYWLRQELFSIETPRIHTITATHISSPELSQTLEIGRSTPTELLNVVNKPAWAQAPNTYNIDILSSAFADLNLADVQPTTNTSVMNKPLDIVMTTFDGLELHLEFFDTGEKLMRMQASYKPELRIATADANVLRTEDAVKAQVNAINRRGKDWLFILTPSRYSMLARSPASILGADPSLAKDVIKDPANSISNPELEQISKTIQKLTPKISSTTSTNAPATASPDVRFTTKQQQRIDEMMQHTHESPEFQRSMSIIDQAIEKTKSATSTTK